MPEVNSKEYWDSRFGSGDWELKGGGLQTRWFAEAQVKYFSIPPDFSGTIIDFGCGQGDSIPVYKKHFPLAILKGVDFSPHAIETCRTRFGDFAEFICGDYVSVPDADVIIASNILEHLTNDKEIVQNLRFKCNKLFVTVPYKEDIFPGDEHINIYDENSFSNLSPVRKFVFRCKGWSEYGLALYYHTIFKNIFRLLTGVPFKKIRRQIMFVFE